MLLKRVHTNPKHQDIHQADVKNGTDEYANRSKLRTAAPREEPSIFTDMERAEILEAMNAEHEAHVHKRLMTLKLKVVDGKKSKDVGDIVGFHPTSVNRIVSQYKCVGIEAITGKRHKQGNRYMSYEEEAAFLDRFRRLGEAGHTISIAEIHKAYQEAVGRTTSRNGIYYLLQKHGWKKIMQRGKKSQNTAVEKTDARYENSAANPNEQKTPSESSDGVSRRGWIWPD